MSPAERFLAAFHDRLPGCTSSAFGTLELVRDGDGARAASGYHALRDALRSAPDGRVLDIACGDGLLLQLLQADGRAACGIDLSRGELAAARRRLGADTPLVQARAQALPFADSHFAAATCHMALMLMDEAEAVARERRRVLQPGGRLAYLVPDQAGDFMDTTTEAFIQAFRRHPLRPDRSGLRLGSRSWRDDTLLHRLLHGAGFSDVTTSRWQGVQRHTVAEAWADFQQMYDIDFVDPAALPVLRRDFEALAAPLAAADGRLERPWRALRVEATAAG